MASVETCSHEAGFVSKRFCCNVTWRMPRCRPSSESTTCTNWQVAPRARPAAASSDCGREPGQAGQTFAGGLPTKQAMAGGECLLLDCTAVEGRVHGSKNPRQTLHGKIRNGQEPCIWFSLFRDLIRPAYSTQSEVGQVWSIECEWPETLMVNLEYYEDLVSETA